MPGLLKPEIRRQAQAEAAQQKSETIQAVQAEATQLGYTPAQIAEALQPTLELDGTFEYKLDDGTVVEFSWFETGFAENNMANTDKVIARNKAGQALRQETNKGGVRLHFGVFKEEVYALALKMDLKAAMSRDAIGKNAVRGAKSGISAARVIKVGSEYDVKVGDYIDPQSKIFDRSLIAQKFATSYRARGGKVGPGLRIQAGDVGMKASETQVLAETYGDAENPSAGVSGKKVMTGPDNQVDPRGGILYRKISTGEGVWMATKLAAKRAGLKVRGATVVGQGLGEVGLAFLEAALRDGSRVVGVEELWKFNGENVAGTLEIDWEKPTLRQSKKWLASVMELRNSGEDLATYKNGVFAKHFVVGKTAAAVRTDIVGVNALGGVLTRDSIKAFVRSGTHQGKRKILSEGANLAETQDGAEEIDRQTDQLLVVKGDLANLGGFHVSNQEAVQNISGIVVTDVLARRSLRGTLTAAWNRVLQVAEEQNISERAAVSLVATDGFMKRSLHLPNAPMSNLEDRVLPKTKRISRMVKVRTTKVRPRISTLPSKR